MKERNHFLVFLSIISILIISSLFGVQNPIYIDYYQDQSPKYASDYRTINFSGYEWIVRNSFNNLQGPGPNLFDNSEESVWIDSNGFLNLKIREFEGQWYCSEVYTQESFGHGTYVFHVSPGWEELDVNSVVGLFTYLDDFNEIDIEFARWGFEDHDNVQYAIQPAGKKGNLFSFTMEPQTTSTIHSFTWCSEYIYFASTNHDSIEEFSINLNKSSLTDNLYNECVYQGNDNPEPSTERVHINFWLMNGLEPIEEKEMTITIEEFRFIPSNCTNYSRETISSYNLSIIMISTLSTIGICIILKKKKFG